MSLFERKTKESLIREAWSPAARAAALASRRLKGSGREERKRAARGEYMHTIAGSPISVQRKAWQMFQTSANRARFNAGFGFAKRGMKGKIQRRARSKQYAANYLKRGLF